MTGQLVHPDARLVDGATGATLAGTALRQRLDEVAATAQTWPVGATFLLAPLTVDTAVTFAGLFTAGRPVALLDPATPAAALTGLIERYQPAAVLGLDAQPAGYMGTPGTWLRTAGDVPVPHPDLAVLLPTSGSTGNPKLVRLSRSNVLANADSIAQALAIDGDETAPTSLPFFYSYGMSVLNSHLYRGARVVVTDDGLISREFWAIVDREKVTSLAAVPYQYTMLKRLRFDPAKHPSITAITQAGGRLSTDLITDFHGRMASVDGRMYIMYGQTEAGPRMTTLPADRLADKLGSAGLAVPGGRLSVLDDAGQETDAPNVTGEVVYRGPNVMMGYADSAADLALGDVQGEALRTGDLGYVDDEGFLFITGRLKRIAKAFGVRVNLDDIENLLRGQGTLAAVAGDEKVVVFVEGADSDRRQKMARHLAESLKLHPSGFDVRDIDALPLLGNGKIDYRSLEAQR